MCLGSIASYSNEYRYVLPPNIWSVAEGDLEKINALFVTQDSYDERDLVTKFTAVV